MSHQNYKTPKYVHFLIYWQLFWQSSWSITTFFTIGQRAKKFQVYTFVIMQKCIFECRLQCFDRVALVVSLFVCCRCVGVGLVYRCQDIWFWIKVGLILIRDSFATTHSSLKRHAKTMMNLNKSSYDRRLLSRNHRQQRCIIILLLLSITCDLSQLCATTVSSFDLFTHSHGPWMIFT